MGGGDLGVGDRVLLVVKVRVALDRLLDKALHVTATIASLVALLEIEACNQLGRCIDVIRVVGVNQALRREHLQQDKEYRRAQLK